MANRFVRWNRLDVATLFLLRDKLLRLTIKNLKNQLTYQFTIMMLTIAAVLDVVQIIAGFLAKQTQLLGARHVKLLLAA